MPSNLRQGLTRVAITILCHSETSTRHNLPSNQCNHVVALKHPKITRKIVSQLQHKEAAELCASYARIGLDRIELWSHYELLKKHGKNTPQQALQRTQNSQQGGKGKGKNSDTLRNLRQTQTKLPAGNDNKTQDQLKQNQPNLQSQKQVPKYSQQNLNSTTKLFRAPCNYYKRGQICPKGDACTFLHDKTKNKPRANATLNTKESI